MKKTRVHTTLFFFYILTFIAISSVIFLNHVDPGFWYQSDSSWAPHFVFDIIIKHHSIYSWKFANATIHLIDTLPFFVFSIFSSNMVSWITYNAIFRLTCYFFCFYGLSKLLFSDIKSSIALMLSCFISLALVASYKLIPFTLDCLFVSGQHMTQLVIAWLCLMLVVKLIYYHNMSRNRNFFYLASLAILVCACTISDELFSFTFVIPALLSMCVLVWYSSTNGQGLKKITLFLVISTLVGRMLWQWIPLNYLRNSALYTAHLLLISNYGQHVAHPFYHELITLIHALFFFIYKLFEHHPYFMLINFTFFILSIFLIVSSLKKRSFAQSKSMQVQFFVLIFCAFSWLVGVGSLFFNYHLYGLLISSSHSTTIPLWIADAFPITTTIPSRSFNALTRDSLGFLITPVFIGIPVMISYFFAHYSKKTQSLWLNILNAFMLLLLIILMASAQKLIPKKSVALTAELRISRCIAYNVKHSHLHTGLADYWIYRPIIVLSNQTIQLAPIYGGQSIKYEHYLSTLENIQHKTIDYWIDSDNTFSSDPIYANYYDTKTDIAYKLSKFGKPAGSFECKGADGKVALHAYIYKNGSLLKSIAH